MSAKGRMTRAEAAGRYVNGEVYTVAEAAKMIGVSRVQVWRLIRSNRLPAIMIGRSYVIRAANLHRYLGWRDELAALKRAPWGRRYR